VKRVAGEELLVAGCWRTTNDDCRCLKLPATSNQPPITKENHCAKKSVFVFCATITNGICLAPDVGDGKTRRFSQLEILAAPTPRTTN
jgi:hypothetical protein